MRAHPKFELQPAFEHAGKHIRAINYEADFEFSTTTGPVVVDMKGVETPIFKQKRKQLLAKGVEVICLKTIGELITLVRSLKLG